MKKVILIILIAISAHSYLSAQTYVDVSTGISNRDNGLLNVSIKKQFTEKFRAGIEFQTGNIDYRFIGGKLIENGTATSVSIPVTWRIFEDDRVRLDLYSRAGIRLQSVPSSDAEAFLLEDNSSFAYFFEPGLMVSMPLSERLNVQGGFTLPLIFESSPVGLFENNVTNLFVNTGYKLSEKSILLFKANTGPAAGASGDSQKYTWSLQAGLRFLIGGKVQKSSLIIDPSY